MFDTLVFILTHVLNPFAWFSDVVTLFIECLMMLPPVVMVLVAFAIVIFIIRLIPL